MEDEHEWQRRRSPENAGTGSRRRGLFFLAGGSLLLVSVLGLLVVKVLPPFGVPLLDAVREDWYYTLLLPLTVPVTVIFVYLHWLSMKFFKHS